MLRYIDQPIRENRNTHLKKFSLHNRERNYTMGFKKDFIWGGATASYQVEGAAYEDGKGLNIWDIFCKDGGHIYENQTGDAACDQYHRYKEDVQIMKEMGMKAYRFSLSWARIMPEGTGTVNEKGLKYYDNPINELLDNGIEPFLLPYITGIFHTHFIYRAAG